MNVPHIPGKRRSVKQGRDSTDSFYSYVKYIDMLKKGKEVRYTDMLKGRVSY
jgi:hypothetical protein